ncbi:carbohydrate-binding module family 50 protein, partial [Thermothielavioides terrestris NRRL 8126]
VTCSYAVQASNGDTCDSVASSWSISVSEFESLNPGVSCPTLVVGHSYCVFGTITTSTTTKQSPTPPPASPTTSPSKTTTSTSTTSAFPYQPTQSGLAANCNQFYFVQAGDTCDAIDQKYQISFSQFYAWNPAREPNTTPDCHALLASTWVCVGVPGASHTTGPQPQMPGVVASCKTYYFVQPGDSCWSIELAKGISDAQLHKWNTGINADCTNLWANAYICVGA